jgi:hypothetical protein
MDVLRRLAKEADDPNSVVLAERTINDYLKPEIDALKAAIERIGNAIDEQAAKGQGEGAGQLLTTRLHITHHQAPIYAQSTSGQGLKSWPSRTFGW